MELFAARWPRRPAIRDLVRTRRTGFAGLRPFGVGTPSDLDSTLGDLLKAHLAPVRSELERLSAEVTELRRTLPPMLVTLREAGDWPVCRDGGGSS